MEEAKKNLLTYAGLRKLEDELHDLKVVKRKEVAGKIKEAREQGDLSENAEYKYPGTQVVFTSPLKRCTETAKILYPEQNPLVIDNLSECNFGEWEGKTADELKNDPDFKKWLAGDSSVKPPRGESNADFTRRVCKMFESIVEGLMKTGTTESVIVTHGGVIMTLLAVYGLPQAKPFEWTMDNGFGYSLRVTPVLWQRDKVCEVFQTIPLPSEND